MNKFLIVISLAVAFGISFVDFPNGAIAVFLAGLLSVTTLILVRRHLPNSADFLQNLFLIGLLLRIGVGMLIHVFELRSFFGNDATLYDQLGYRLTQIWFEGVSTSDPTSQRALNLGDSGWGMNYLVGGIYSLVGRNILAAQFFCTVIGAATIPLAYKCAHKIFGNIKVGKVSALMVALFPAFIIWSCQLLKDGLMIFLLVLSITLVLELQEKLNYLYIGLLLLSIFSILSLRFYIFYMIVVAIVGSFVIGSSSTQQSMFKRLAAVAVIGVSLIYFGALRSASKNIDQYASLERIQRSRADLATSQSGFGSDLDVSTTEGALTALPIGLTYLMFAPFPWQAGNLRQAIALPEVLLWWSMMPFLVMGLIYTIKYRLRNAIAILVFAPMLMVGYALFLGNVGTAYRQRTQIQVFLYMFIAAGYTVWREKKENNQLVKNFNKQKQIKNLHPNRKLKQVNQL